MKSFFSANTYNITLPVLRLRHLDNIKDLFIVKKNESRNCEGIRVLFREKDKNGYSPSISLVKDCPLSLFGQ